MISRYSVKRPYTVLVGVVLVIVLGVVSLSRMTADLLPNMSFQYALIITTEIGASPEAIEMGVTAPIESAMATTANIKNITSTSYNSYSMVVCEYEQNANMDSVVIEIQQKLDQLEGGWDDTVGTPMIMQINPDMLPIMVSAVDVDNMDKTDISDYVEKELIPALESVEGVASVSASGQIEESVAVTINPDKITALNEKIQKEIKDNFVDAQKEIDTAKNEVQSGQDKLSDTQDQLENASKQLQSQKEQLEDSKKDLNKQLKDLKKQRKSLNDTLKSINTFVKSKEYQDLVKLEDGIEQGNEAIDVALRAGATEEMVAKQRKEIAAYQKTLNASNKEIKKQFSGLKTFGVEINTYKDVAGAAETISTLLTQVNTGITTIENGIAQVEAGKISLADATDALNTNTALAALKMGESSAQLTQAQAGLEDAQDSLDSAKKQALDAADLNEVLSKDTIEGLLTAQNFDMPAGYAADENADYLVRVGEAITSVTDLENLVLLDMGMESVGVIRLSDVADVKMQDDADENYAVINGNPGIMLSMEKQTGYATGDVTDRLLEKFKFLEKQKEGLHITVLMNQGIYIDIIVRSVLQNIVFGAVLAIIVLLLFLRDIRPTLVIACSIPLSVIVAVVLMYFTNISLNIISMSGLVLGIGMLVDNSIVVIENIYRLKGEGYTVRKAAVEGASQVTGAIIASTLTTVSVYAPIIFTEGITRQLFVDLAFTIAFTLVASLVVALTFVPAMSSAILRRTKTKQHPWFDAFRGWYGKALAVCLRFKPVVFILAVVLLLGSVGLAFSRGMTFMNMDMETNQLSTTITAKKGEKLSLEELTADADEVMERISSLDGVQTVGAMVGGSTLGMLGGSNKDSVSMYILLDENSGAKTSVIADEIKKQTEDMNCLVTTETGSMDFTSFLGSGLSIQIKGANLDTLQELASQVSSLLNDTDGTIDVEDGLDDTTPQYTITVDKEKAAAYGYTVAQVYQLVYSQMASNSAVTTIKTDLKDYKVYLQTMEQSDTTLSDIRNLTFSYTNKDGETEDIPLTKICTMKETTTLSTILRDAQSRYITVSCGVDKNHNITLVSNQVQEKIDAMQIPEGYSISMKGEDENIYEAMEQMLLMLLLAVVFIYLIMVAQFQSLLSPFIIMFTIPLAFTGGFLGLYLVKEEVSVIAMLGFVMLSGLIVNNGIVLIDYINQARRGGATKGEAIIEAGMTRLRPILMTALTTIISMSTMALGIGEGSTMMRPMAITIIGGMIYGTILTLIVIPCIYDAFNREKSMVDFENL